MKYSILRIILAALVVLGASCGRRQSDKDGEAEIPAVSFSLTEKSADLSSLDISFLTLEQTDKSVVGDIGAIETCDSTFILSDSSNYVLLEFNRNGKFIRQIGTRGNGPGEYIDVTSFFFDKTKNIVGVYDEQQSKLLLYDYTTARLKEELEFPDIVTGGCIPSGDSLIWYNQGYEGENSDRYFLVSDYKGKISNSFVEKKFKSGYMTGVAYPFYRLDGKIYGYTPYDMTVYSLTSTEAVPAFRIEIDGMSTPSVEELNKLSDNGQSYGLFNALSTSGFISFFRVLETESVLSLTAIANKEKFSGLYDKNTGNSVFMKNELLAGRLGLGKSFQVTPFSMDGCILAVIEPMAVREAIEEGMDIHPALAGVINDLPEDSNPIIAKIRFKLN